MNKKYLIIITVFLAVFLSVSFIKTEKEVKANPLGDHSLEIYKTATCGCCGVYNDYMNKEGVVTNVHDLASLNEIKSTYNIPYQYQSCHTTVMGDYFIEGHIPLSVIERLHRESPDIKGIMMPGMPSGTPGMPGPQTEDWVIYQMHHNGDVSEYMRM